MTPVLFKDLLSSDELEKPSEENESSFNLELFVETALNN
jgi:hypothetical protein